MLKQKIKAAFLDRDGVINKDHAYVHKVEEFEFIDGVFEACRRLNKLGYAIVIVTNQAGIGRGYFSESDYHVLNDWMIEQFKKEGVEILATHYCPTHPKHGIGEYKKESPYRKPNPQMILDAIAEYHIDPEQSFIVGDKVSDIEAGINAKLGKQFFIQSQYLDGKVAGSVPVYGSLLEMVEAEFS